MALSPLATLRDIYTRAPDLVADLNPRQAEALLADASAIVRAYAGRDWTLEADVPDGVAGIVTMMVIRALRNDGVVSEVDGNYTVNYGPQASDRLYLTKVEKLTLRSRNGAFSVDTYGPVGYLGSAEDEDWT